MTYESQVWAETLLWEGRRLEIEVEGDEIEYWNVEYHYGIEFDHCDGGLREGKEVVAVLL